MKRKLLVLLLLAACALSVGAGRAAADTPPSYADACGSANNFDYAVCERVDYIGSELAAQQDRLDLAWSGVWFAAGVALATACGGVIFAWRFYRQ